ncbi:aspartate/glutamate racemase family protein [Aureimonas sp. Leaf324]|jgi:Asp/Glu/hydantoin racemase|uniref:aspartate/glutamate racemase family protein n=1 Tax=Aureimonas sp. Leaf324 TaxID=1736336 RepID=UPI0006F7776C|nr:aspartate/glutamate racemase family protein [Aureimonas sp. Leaf324]KQQ87632.1 hydrogenase expression protein HupH [Aureimonas sp. Leaf324]
MTRIALVNPNTSVATTETMLCIARRTQPDLAVEGLTAPFGPSLITDEAGLVQATAAVSALAERLEGFDGVIVAAFGDPGLEALRARLAVRVTGIAEAGMAEAVLGARRFAVATTTPELVGAIARTARRYGFGEAFLGTFLTPGDPIDLMGDPARLVEALAEACREGVQAGAEAVVIGGGPLAEAARALNGQIGVEIIEPVPAAVRLVLARLIPEVSR